MQGGARSTRRFSPTQAGRLQTQTRGQQVPERGAGPGGTCYFRLDALHLTGSPGKARPWSPPLRRPRGLPLPWPRFENSTGKCADRLHPTETAGKLSHWPQTCHTGQQPRPGSKWKSEATEGTALSKSEDGRTLSVFQSPGSHPCPPPGNLHLQAQLCGGLWPL